MNNQHITFIGGGNMAYSLISGLIASGFEPDSICASDPLEEQRNRLTKLGIRTTQSNTEAVKQANVIVLALKPQVLCTVLQSIDTLNSDQLLISIAAGVSLAALSGSSNADQPVVRCMPNTPALLGAGITGLYANDKVSSAQRATAETILGAVGKTLWVNDERALDAVTAVSGSGPAYFFYLMEAMVNAGISLGLDPDTAIELTLETAYGAALMARQRTHPPAQLRANVTSPGGTTAAALSILDNADVAGSIRQALAGAATRSKELAKEFGPS